MIATIDDLRGRVSGYAVAILLLTVPLLAAVGQAVGTGGLTEAGLMVAISLLVRLERRRAPSGTGVQLAASAGLAVAVAALVWLMRGHPWQADAHMAFFAAFALTGLFCNWRPVALYAGLIAAHHLVLNYALTEAVFPGTASLGRVMLHAVVLVVQAVPMIWLSTVLARLYLTSEINLDEARQASRTAEELAVDQSRERAETAQVVEALNLAMKRLSQGEMEARMEGTLPRRHAALQSRFNTFVAMIEGMVGQISAGAQGLMTSAGQMAEASRQSADRAGAQFQTLEQSLRALEGLTESVQATAQLARDADARVSDNRREAEEGGAILADAVKAMERIEDSSNQISRISEVMEDIAFQTNLLALNAGVEAARAGEAGKGFAVVATEVRALAQRATNSAKEIRALVNTSRENVAKGSDLVQRTNGSLAALIQGSGKNAETVAEIATAMNVQSAGLGDLTGKLRQLEDAAREGAAVADLSSSKSETLRGDAAVMLTAAGAFRDAQAWSTAERQAEDAAWTSTEAWREEFSGESRLVEDYFGQEPGEHRGWSARLGLPAPEPGAADRLGGQGLHAAE
ncbi:MAG: methyl-accepting chemotaxis protein [Paracoccaceae bacterium]